jgi:hypothetical protein
MAPQVGLEPEREFTEFFTHARGIDSTTANLRPSAWRGCYARVGHASLVRQPMPRFCNGSHPRHCGGILAVETPAVALMC